MVIFLIILYVIFGAAAAFGYKYLSYLWEIHYDEECGTIVAIVVGIFWPVVAPFAFAVVLAQHYAELKEQQQ